LSRELSGKRLELLKDTVPGLARVAVLMNPTEVSAARQWRGTEEAARRVGPQVQAPEVRAPDDFAGVVAAARTAHTDGLIVLAGPRAHDVTDEPLPGQRGHQVGVGIWSGEQSIISDNLIHSVPSRWSRSRKPRTVCRGHMGNQTTTAPEMPLGLSRVRRAVP